MIQQSFGSPIFGVVNVIGGTLPVSYARLVCLSAKFSKSNGFAVTDPSLSVCIKKIWEDFRMCAFMLNSRSVEPALYAELFSCSLSLRKLNTL